MEDRYEVTLPNGVSLLLEKGWLTATGPDGTVLGRYKSHPGLGDLDRDEHGTPLDVA